MRSTTEACIAWIDRPVLMAVSVAALRALESQGFDLKGRVAYVAGHSLGEYSALAAAGMFSVADTARLLKTRGQAIENRYAFAPSAFISRDSSPRARKM